MGEKDAAGAKRARFWLFFLTFGAGLGLAGSVGATGSSAGNVARQGRARQSSEGWGGVAARAIDGNTSGDYNGGSVTHTQQGANSWLEVDLGAPHAIDRVVVHNRTDCCAERLNGARVEISTSPCDRVSPVEQAALLGSGSPLLIPFAAQPVGRYVCVRQPRDDFLSVAELEVYGTPAPSGANVARQGRARQSSEGFGGVASRAIDGNTRGDFNGGSVTHTQQGANSWLEVDLGRTHAIEQVLVYNRTDCCSERLAGARVEISANPCDQQAPTAQVDLPNLNGAPHAVLTFDAKPRGRYVCVRQPRNDFLSVAEVQVYGAPAADEGLKPNTWYCLPGIGQGIRKVGGNIECFTNKTLCPIVCSAVAAPTPLKPALDLGRSRPCADYEYHDPNHYCAKALRTFANFRMEQAAGGGTISGDALFVLRSALWKDYAGGIPVCWESFSQSSPEDRALVEGAVGETWSAVSGARFVGWQECSASSKGVRIAVSDVEKNPHTKVLGSALDGRKDGMVLNFTFKNWGQNCDGESWERCNTAAPGAASFFGGKCGWVRRQCIRTIAVHEFGHALGFAHEQARPDDTPAWCDKRQPTGESLGDKVFGDWDEDSIMNYCNGRNHWEYHKLSNTDVVGAMAFYGPPQHPAVVLFEDEDFRGDSRTYSGDVSLVVGFNDQTSAIRLAGATSVSVYEHEGFRGLCQTFTASNGKLQNEPIGNDHISALKVNALCPEQVRFTGFAEGKKCMNVDHGSTADGTAVFLWDCEREENERFRLDPSTARLHGVGGMCVDAINPNALQMKHCNNSPSQRWFIVKNHVLAQPGAAVLLNGTSDGPCLTVANTTGDNGTALRLAPCTKNAAQQLTPPSISR